MKKMIIAALFALPFGAMAQNDLVELVRSDLRVEMKAIVMENMGLTEEQSTAFWPMYNEYERARTAVWDKKIALIKDYAANYEGMTEEKAKELLTSSMNLDKEFDTLRMTHIKKMEKALPATVAGRFYQIDSRLAKLMDLQLAQDIPLVMPAK